MTTIKINEQIAFLRKQKGLTQEELANALGVTNQAVSKWESAQCCPDIQLLPDLAKIFDVSIDELIGYKKTVPWKEKDYAADHVSSWGLSICSEPEGCTGRKNNNIFFSLGEGYVAPNGSQMRDLKITMEQFSNLNVLKTLFALHGLTVSDFDLFVTADQIAAAAFLKEEEVETALRELHLTVKEEEGTYKYRLDGSSSYLPPLLSFLYKL